MTERRKTKLDIASELVKEEIAKLMMSVGHQLALQGIDEKFVHVACTEAFARTAGELCGCCTSSLHAERRALANFYDGTANSFVASGQLRAEERN